MTASSQGKLLRSSACRPPAPPLRDKFGVCQWFHYEDRAGVDQALELIAELGVRHLRTGISWADYLRPGGKNWYDWQMDRLRQSGVEILLSVWHTPPSLGEQPACNAPRAACAIMLISSTQSLPSMGTPGIIWNYGMNPTTV